MITRPAALSPDLADLSDEVLDRRRAQAPAVLAKALTTDDARALYEREVLPLEREAVYRQRLSDDEAVDLLFITVGGQADTPIAAALRWNARHVVLLHSDQTGRQAAQTATALGWTPGTYTLREIGNGTDPTLLYQEVRDQWNARGRPTRTIVDLSGGYKTMSTAAGAIGFLLPGARVTYVETRQVRVHGATAWLDTRVEVLPNPYEVFGDIDRENAHRLSSARRYRAAAVAWRELADRTRARSDEWRARLSEALDRADRMDLAAAADGLEALNKEIERDLRQDPRLRQDPLTSTDARTAMLTRSRGLRAVEQLAGPTDPTRDVERLRSPSYFDFIALLLHLAESRISDGENDLAALYAYRAMEAIPQRRLASLGYDVSAFDWQRLFKDAGRDTPEAVEELSRKLARMENEPAMPALPSKVDRGLAFAVLALALDDQLIDKGALRKLDGLASARNRSVLAHGLTYIKADDARRLVKETRALFERLLQVEGVSAGDQDALHQRHRDWSVF